MGTIRSDQLRNHEAAVCCSEVTTADRLSQVYLRGHSRDRRLEARDAVLDILVGVRAILREREARVHHGPAATGHCWGEARAWATVAY